MDLLQKYGRFTQRRVRDRFTQLFARRIWPDDILDGVVLALLRIYGLHMRFEFTQPFIVESEMRSRTRVSFLVFAERQHHQKLSCITKRSLWCSSLHEFVCDLEVLRDLLHETITTELPCQDDYVRLNQSLQSIVRDDLEQFSLVRFIRGVL